MNMRLLGTKTIEEVISDMVDVSNIDSPAEVCACCYSASAALPSLTIISSTF